MHLPFQCMLLATLLLSNSTAALRLPSFRNLRRVMSSKTTYNGICLGLPPTTVLSPLSSPLILATGSKTRALIVNSMSLPYTLHTIPIDERNIGYDLRALGTVASATALVSLLSQSKATPILQSLTSNTIPDFNSPTALILTSDQVATHPTLGILEKAQSLEEAQTFFDAYKAVPCVTTVGAVRITHWPSQVSVVTTFEATVTFGEGRMAAYDAYGGGGGGEGRLLRDLGEGGAPILECAGALMIENPIVKTFIDEVAGGEDSVLGLRRESLVVALNKCQEKVRRREEEEEEAVKSNLLKF